jgi:hypothetical protein
LIKERCDNFYPIPTDAIFETNPYYNSKTRLVDSDLYFIDFKPGDYIKDYKRHSRLELPENWAHGYSTGVTANDNDRTIQLWLVVW